MQVTGGSPSGRAVRGRFVVIDRSLSRLILTLLLVGVLWVLWWALEPGNPMPAMPGEPGLVDGAGSAGGRGKAAGTGGEAGWLGREREAGEGPAAGATPGAAAVSLEPVVDANFFARFRLDRARSYSRQEEELKALLDNPKLDASARAEAQRELLALLRLAQREEALESLLRAEGYRDVIVTIGPKGATVLVSAPRLTPQQVAGIGDLVARLAGVSVESVTVSAVAGGGEERGI